MRICSGDDSNSDIIGNIFVFLLLVKNHYEVRSVRILCFKDSEFKGGALDLCISEFETITLNHAKV